MIGFLAPWTLGDTIVVLTGAAILFLVSAAVYIIANYGGPQ